MQARRTRSAPQRRRPASDRGYCGPDWRLWASLAVVALLAWQENRSAEPGTANAVGAPNLQVDQTNIDFGDVPVNQMVKASFKLSNTGDGTLNIVAPPVPEVVEGC